MYVQCVGRAKKNTMVVDEKETREKKKKKRATRYVLCPLVCPPC